MITSDLERTKIGRIQLHILMEPGILAFTESSAAIIFLGLARAREMLQYSVV